MFLDLKMTVALVSNLPRANVRPAENTFPADQYVTIPNVPVFAEHQTKSRDGRKLVFGSDQLQAVADRCNRRIEETGDYSAITIGHTSDPGDSDSKEPEVIGGAGRFRLGTLGEPGSRQRYCILADFHVKRDKLDLYNAHPRRSPELWLEDSYDEMFLDPISLLGAEAPRLDMGLAPLVNAKGGDDPEIGRSLYTAVRSGRDREKYAAAAPSCSSVFVPADGKAKYAADTPQQQAKKEALMLAPEDIKQIVDAIEQLDVMVAMRDFMPVIPRVQGLLAAEDQVNAAANEINPDAGLTPEVPVGEGAPPAPGDDVPPAPVEPPAEPPAPAPTPSPETPPPADTPPEVPPAEKEPEKKYAADAGETGKSEPKDGSPNVNLDDLSDDDIEKYLNERRKKKYAANGSVDGKAGENPAQASVDPGVKAPAKGSVDADQEKMVAKYSALQAKVDALEGERVERANESRKARLTTIRYHRAFDLDKAVERCKYDKMSDEQFGEHVSFITESAAPTLVNQAMPVPDELLDSKQSPPAVRTSPERYTKEKCEEAAKIVFEKRQAGEAVTYETVLDNIVNGRPAV